jgi:hypothetical protein
LARTFSARVLDADAQALTAMRVEAAKVQQESFFRIAFADDQCGSSHDALHRSCRFLASGHQS